MNRHYCLNKDAASFEDFGDEIVVIHNHSGVFYTLKGRSTLLWRALLGGLSAAILEERLLELQPDEATVIRDMIAEFERSGIVFAAERPDTAGGSLGWADSERAFFARNDDFDDLFRLDPIHDVGPEGWPARES